MVYVNTKGNEQQIQLFNLFDAEEAVKMIPVAETRACYARCVEVDKASSMIELTSRKAVFVDGHDVAIVGKHFKPVQASEAFNPILQSLVSIDANVKISLGYYKSLFWMNVLVDDVVFDTVQIGFQAKSGNDGLHSLSYNYGVQKVHRYVEDVQFKAKTEIGDGPLPEPSKHGGYRYIEIIGYRQVCSNGMKVRIPLEEALGDIAAGSKGTTIRKVLNEIWTEPVLKEHVVSLLRQSAKIRHRGDVESKIAQQKTAIELIVSLRDPMKRLIQRAKKVKLSDAQMKTILLNYFGELTANRIAEYSKAEEKSAWGLYNMMTDYITHADIGEYTKKRLEDGSADYLVMLPVPVVAKKK